MLMLMLNLELGLGLKLDLESLTQRKNNEQDSKTISKPRLRNEVMEIFIVGVIGFVGGRGKDSDYGVSNNHTDCTFCSYSYSYSNSFILSV